MVSPAQQSRYWTLVLGDTLVWLAGAMDGRAGTRVNLEPNEPFDLWGSVVRMILMYAIIFVAAIWLVRHSVQRDVLPRKRRLEALLKELDG